MTAFLTALSIFHLCISAGALGRGIRMTTAEGRAAWRSKRLYAFTLVVAWTYPLIAGGCVALAWQAHHGVDAHVAGPLMIAPLAWLLVMGFVFAAIDVWEDGIFGNALYPPEGRD